MVPVRSKKRIRMGSELDTRRQWQVTGFLKRLQIPLVLRCLSAVDLWSNPFFTGETISLKEQSEITEISSNSSFFSQSFIVKQIFTDKNSVTRQLNKPEICRERLSYPSARGTILSQSHTRFLPFFPSWSRTADAAPKGLPSSYK